MNFIANFQVEENARLFISAPFCLARFDGSIGATSVDDARA